MSLSSALEAVHRKQDDLFVTDFPNGIEVIFRLPTFKRAQQYSALLRSAKLVGLENIVYESIFRECVEDEHLANFNEDLPAGIPESIAKTILFLSGASDGEEQFDYTEELLNLYREEVNSFINLMKRYICSAFNYRFSDLDRLNYQDLIKVFVQAERLMKEQGIIEENIKLIRPGEEEKPKPFNISDIIKQDTEDYRRFDYGDNEAARQKHPAYQGVEEKARQEEHRYKTLMARKYAAYQKEQSNKRR